MAEATSVGRAPLGGSAAGYDRPVPADAAANAAVIEPAEHRDRFDLWRWSRQALGPVGVVLGGAESVPPAT